MKDIATIQRENSEASVPKWYRALMTLLNKTAREGNHQIDIKIQRAGITINKIHWIYHEGRFYESITDHMYIGTSEIESQDEKYLVAQFNKFFNE